MLKSHSKFIFPEDHRKGVIRDHVLQSVFFMLTDDRVQPRLNGVNLTHVFQFKLEGRNFSSLLNNETSNGLKIF
jgi:hypothetical protein